MVSFVRIYAVGVWKREATPKYKFYPFVVHHHLILTFSMTRYLRFEYPLLRSTYYYFRFLHLLVIIKDGISQTKRWTNKVIMAIMIRGQNVYNLKNESSCLEGNLHLPTWDQTYKHMVSLFRFKCE